MRIAERVKNKKPTLSLEFFPPKEGKKLDKFWSNAEELDAVDPDFVSITCGAGGSTQGNTLPVANKLKNDLNFEVMVHQTCVNSTKDDLYNFLDDIAQSGIENILALRGDEPKESSMHADNKDFEYASELVNFLKTQNPDLSVAAAAYPGAHPESKSIDDDFYWLKHKVEQGAEFLHTQFFFDNRQYFDFVDRLNGIGIDCPVIPGVLPIFSFNSLRFILSVSGTMIPGSLYLNIEKIMQDQGPEAVLEFGIEFASKQITDLLEKGAPGIHLYTLNRAQPCLQIISNCPF
ncbi:MAG: methylenetetrahydrofolate reductase [NAD(P)H] [Thermodesulfobacteriota bacterium]